MHIIFMWEIIVVSHRKKNASLTISTLQKSSSLCFPAFSANIQWLNLDIIIRRCRLTVLWFLEFNYWNFPACNFKSLQWIFFMILIFHSTEAKKYCNFFFAVFYHCHFFNDVLVLLLLYCSGSQGWVCYLNGSCVLMGCITIVGVVVGWMTFMSQYWTTVVGVESNSSEMTLSDGQ